MKYLTDVNPGSSIVFPSSEVGWRVNGQGASAGIDDSLGAGPAGATADWPGSSVSVSRDGGITWETRYRDAAGIWGLDFISGTTGWVVGVTSLARTTDGGASWQAAAEPSAGDPLVAVDFTSGSTGYGLSVSGHLSGRPMPGTPGQGSPFPVRAVRSASPAVTAGT
jgi:hypothetical protein